MTKYIVKVVDGSEHDGEFWLAEAEGSTPHREDAYRYTARQLRNHVCDDIIRRRDVVLIPVKETQDEDCNHSQATQRD